MQCSVCSMHAWMYVYVCLCMSMYVYVCLCMSMYVYVCMDGWMHAFVTMYLSMLARQQEEKPIDTTWQDLSLPCPAWHWTSRRRATPTLKPQGPSNFIQVHRFQDILIDLIYFDSQTSWEFPALTSPDSAGEAVFAKGLAEWLRTRQLGSGDSPRLMVCNSLGSWTAW